MNPVLFFFIINYEKSSTNLTHRTLLNQLLSKVCGIHLIGCLVTIDYIYIYMSLMLTSDLVKQTRSPSMAWCSTTQAWTPWWTSPTSRSGRPEGFVKWLSRKTQTYAIKLVPLIIVTEWIV